MIWNSAHRSVHPKECLARIVRVVEGGPSARLLGCRWRLDTSGTVAPLIPTTSFRLTRTSNQTMCRRCPLRLRQHCECGRNAVISDRNSRRQGTARRLSHGNRWKSTLLRLQVKFQRPIGTIEVVWAQNKVVNGADRYYATPEGIRS